ncbi:hypothetical protein C8R45DRAFT_1026457 [Mycena sanguinolenta]|nr:hypothetical protein C8R45DRAFT_1026457 [Mycena sanguinolenta]
MPVTAARRFVDGRRRSFFFLRSSCPIFFSAFPLPFSLALSPHPSSHPHEELLHPVWTVRRIRWGDHRYFSLCSEFFIAISRSAHSRSFWRFVSLNTSRPRPLPCPNLTTHVRPETLAGDVLYMEMYSASASARTAPTLPAACSLSHPAHRVLRSLPSIGIGVHPSSSPSPSSILHVRACMRSIFVHAF